VLRLLLNTLFPVTCCGCGQTGSYVCSHCFDQLEFLRFPIELKLERLYLDEVYAMANYLAPLSTLIQTMKYQSVKPIGKVLGQWLYFYTPITQFSFLTATPIHSSRARQRGFNQAEEIAKSLSFYSHIPYLPLLKKNKATRSLATLTHRTERLSELSNTFEISSTYSTCVTNESILVIDDVTTTGSTLNEAAKALKQAGAKKVTGLVVAHGQ
jgi:competence protein ComFC